MYANVVAINSYGESIVSNDGNGAIVVVVPSAPVKLTTNQAGTSVNTISFTWNLGPSNGGRPIIDYRVSYD